MKFILVFLLICISITGFSQIPDTIDKDYNSLKFNPRIGFSYQKNSFAEVGVSLHKYIVYIPNVNKWHYGFASLGFYASSEVLVRTDKTIIGPKIGYEYAVYAPTNGSAMGLEMTYYSDFAKGNLAITPKIGLSIGFIEIYYGYNFLLNNVSSM
jgi:hypothetical protein